MTNAGANVRLIREQVGMSLRAAADAAGLDPATLSRIETGKTKLNDELARKIAGVLHVSVGMLFTEPGMVETAMLRMRKAPLLTREQLLHWTGPESFEEAAEQTYLHTAISVASRHVFAISVTDSANAPEVHPGDLLLFDARRTPRFGDLVIAQNTTAEIFIGMYRPSESIDVDGRFVIVPANRLFAETASSERSLLLRGVRVEQRRTF